MTRSRRYGLAAALLMSSGLAAQAQPIDGTGQGVSPDSLVSELVSCPQEALSAAYADMGALEGDAVAKEVLRLCTERAEVITDFLNAQADLGRALSEVAASRPAPAIAPPAPTAPPPPEPSEGAASGGDTAGFGAMRDRMEELRELAIANDAQVSAMRTGPDRTVGTAAGETADGLEPVSALETTDPELDLPAGETVWEVVYTTRSGEGGWLAAIRGSLGLRVALPTPGEAEATSRSPFEPQDPLLMRVGETLRDGREIARIDSGGVWVHAGEGSSDTELLPWAENGDAAAPGVMEWTVTEGAAP